MLLLGTTFSSMGLGFAASPGRTARRSLRRAAVKIFGVPHRSEEAILTIFLLIWRFPIGVQHVDGFWNIL